MTDRDHRRGEPTDADLAASRRALDDLLSGSGVDLDDASLWEPVPDLEEQLVAAAVGEPAGQAPRRRSRRWAIAVGSIAAVAILVVGAISLTRDDPPDWIIALHATELAPGADGTVSGWNEASGTRVRLDLGTLPPAPEGFFYELWFSADDVHISGGTFRSTDDVELWVAVARKDFPRVWITLEPVDDDESPSRQTVLDSV
jgi:hypothetical protein